MSSTIEHIFRKKQDRLCVTFLRAWTAVGKWARVRQTMMTAAAADRSQPKMELWRIFNFLMFHAISVHSAHWEIQFTQVFLTLNSLLPNLRLKVLRVVVVERLSREDFWLLLYDSSRDMLGGEPAFFLSPHGSTADCGAFAKTWSRRSCCFSLYSCCGGHLENSKDVVFLR